MVVIAVLGGLVVLVFLAAFLLDRKAKRRGNAVRSAGAIQQSIKTARGEQRALNRLRRPKW